MLEKQFPGLRFRGSLSGNGHVSSLEASWVLPHLHIWVPVWRAPTASPHSHRRRPVPCRSERTECEVGSGSPPLWRELKQKHTRSQTMTVSVGSFPPAPGDGPPKWWCSGSERERIRITIWQMNLSLEMVTHTLNVNVWHVFQGLQKPHVLVVPWSISWSYTGFKICK